MSMTLTLLLNHYAASLQQNMKWEAAFQKCIQDFKALKSGDLSLEQLVVTDNGYEFMPAPPPAAQTNGQQAEDISNLEEQRGRNPEHARSRHKST